MEVSTSTDIKDYCKKKSKDDQIWSLKDNIGLNLKSKK